MTLAWLVLVIRPVASTPGWECAMSGSRAAPCPCSAGHAHDDEAGEPPPQAQLRRKPCCARRSIDEGAIAADLVAPQSSSLDLVAVAPVATLALAPPLVSLRSAPQARGPPTFVLPLYLVHRSLLV